jgi:hypothetical protein
MYRVESCLSIQFARCVGHIHLYLHLLNCNCKNTCAQRFNLLTCFCRRLNALVVLPDQRIIVPPTTSTWILYYTVYWSTRDSRSVTLLVLYIVQLYRDVLLSSVPTHSSQAYLAACSLVSTALPGLRIDSIQYMVSSGHALGTQSPIHQPVEQAFTSISFT